MNDSELQQIVSKYFDHTNGVKPIGFPGKPVTFKDIPYAGESPPDDATNKDIPEFPRHRVGISEKGIDFWKRVEEQRLANLQKTAIDDGVSLVCVAHPDNRRWWQTHPLYVVLLIALLIGLCLVLPDLPEILVKIHG